MTQPIPVIVSGYLYDLATGADGTRTFTLQTVFSAEPLPISYTGTADLDGWLSQQQQPHPPILVFAARHEETQPIIAQSICALTWSGDHWRIDSLPLQTQEAENAN